MPVRSVGESVLLTRIEEHESDSQMARFFRVAVSVGLLALLLYSLGIPGIADSARDLRWWALPLAVVLQLLLFALANVRWWVLLNYHGCGYRPSTLLVPYFIGVFFNNVLPTTIGGSLFRMYYIYRENQDATVAASPLIAERLLGLVAMIATAAAIVPFLSPEHAYVRVLAEVLPWLLAVALAALALIGSRFAYGAVHLALARRCRFRVMAVVLRIAETVHAYLARPRLVAQVFAVSLGLQVMSAGVYYLLGLGLGATLALQDYLVIVPLAFLAATLPVSVGISLPGGAAPQQRSRAVLVSHSRGIQNTLPAGSPTAHSVIAHGHRGATTRNSRSIPRSCNAALGRPKRAVHPVALLS